MAYAVSETARAVRLALGMLLRRRREDAELRLSDVAGSAGLSTAHLSEVERGLKDVSTERLSAICRALEVPIGELYWDLARELGAAGADRVAVEGDPRQQLRRATSMLSGEALRAAAQFSVYLAATHAPTRRPIGFLR